MNVTVAVATFGSPDWSNLARTRAIPSALDLNVPVVHIHGATLHEARNEALAAVTTEFVCFLDADDQLERGYFDAMATGTADIRAPAVRYVIGGTPQPERIMRVAGHSHACTGDCLVDGNWIVIGAVARTERLRAVGGFRDFEWSEDWDLWLRCYQAGATVEQITGAVYRAHVRQDSRNRAPDRQQRLDAHRAIALANGVPVP